MNGGQLDGVRILEGDTIEMMAQNQIGELRVEALRTRLPERSRDLDLPPDLPTTWGLNFLINTEPILSGRSAGSLTWGDLYNTYFWLDLRNKIAAAFLSQTKPFADPIILTTFSAFERAIYAAHD